MGRKKRHKSLNAVFYYIEKNAKVLEECKNLTKVKVLLGWLFYICTYDTFFTHKKNYIIDIRFNIKC